MQEATNPKYKCGQQRCVIIVQSRYSVQRAARLQGLALSERQNSGRAARAYRPLLPDAIACAMVSF